jgi:hypothetical protein
MDKNPATDGNRFSRPLPIVLTLAETKQVAGGLNPQPLPPNGGISSADAMALFRQGLVRRRIMPAHLYLPGDPC